MTKLYAPQVERYAHRLGRFNYMGADRNTVYDAETYRLLDMLFQKLDLIEQRPDSDGIWDLWLQADRGPIEAFGNFQEMLEDEEVSSYEEYVKLWRESYPAEHDWYSFTAVRVYISLSLYTYSFCMCMWGCFYLFEGGRYMPTERM